MREESGPADQAPLSSSVSLALGPGNHREAWKLRHYRTGPSWGSGRTEWARGWQSGRKDPPGRAALPRGRGRGLGPLRPGICDSLLPWVSTESSKERPWVLEQTGRRPPSRRCVWVGPCGRPGNDRKRSGCLCLPLRACGAHVSINCAHPLPALTRPSAAPAVKDIAFEVSGG